MGDGGLAKVDDKLFGLFNGQRCFVRSTIHRSIVFFASRVNCSPKLEEFEIQHRIFSLPIATTVNYDSPRVMMKMIKSWLTPGTVYKFGDVTIDKSRGAANKRGCT